VKKHTILVAVVLLSTTGVLYAADGELGATVDLSYHSRWLSKGALGYGQQGAFFKTLDVDLYGTGFGVNVTHRNACSSGYVDQQRFDYRPYYGGRIAEGTAHETKFNISAGYEHYTDVSRNQANTTWEWILACSWPNLLPNGIVPSYICHYEYPATSDSPWGHTTGKHITGAVHRLRLAKELTSPDLPRPMNLIGEVAYTDGLGAADHDWSYAMFGVNTNVEVCQNCTFTPGIYQQISMDDSVNKNKNVTYCILSMKIRTK
jgi:hypothetical protein